MSGELLAIFVLITVTAFAVFNARHSEAELYDAQREIDRLKRDLKEAWLDIQHMQAEADERLDP